MYIYIYTYIHARSLLQPCRRTSELAERRSILIRGGSRAKNNKSSEGGNLVAIIKWSVYTGMLKPLSTW